MEELTKTQLILLALLVSFVTSIATGIVTITLIDQAPPGVTQTINRVVERTVEKVVPGQAASVITKETTVVVKEENLIVDAVEKNSRYVVRIALADKDGKFTKPLGIGVIVLDDGTIVTDSLNLTDSKEYLVKMSSGNIHSATLDYVDPVSGVASLKIKILVDEKDEKKPSKFSKPNFGSDSDFKLGQTVIGIGGLNGDSILAGIVSKLNKKVINTSTEDEKEGEADKVEKEKEVLTKEIEVLDTVESSLAFSPDYSGGPLLDIDGFVLGINMKRKDGDFSIPIGTVLDIISKKLENAENQGE